MTTQDYCFEKFKELQLVCCKTNGLCRVETDNLNSIPKEQIESLFREICSACFFSK